MHEIKYKNMDEIFNPNPAPPIVNPATIIVMAEAIKRGNTIRNACQLVGMTTQHYHSVMKSARTKIKEAEDRGEAVDETATTIMFYRAVKQAEAILEDTLVDTWYNLRHTDWKAARDLLARRFPKDWAETKNKNVAISGPGGGAIQVQNMDLSKLTTEELENFERLLEKVPQSGDDTDGEGEA